MWDLIFRMSRFFAMRRCSVPVRNSSGAKKAQKVFSDKWCRRFWEFIMRRRLGLIRFFLANQRTLIEAWREPLTKRGFHLKASDPDHRRRMMEIPRPLPEFREEWERQMRPRQIRPRARPSTAAGSSSGGHGQRRARSGTQRAPEMESSPKRSRPTSSLPEKLAGNTPCKQCPVLCPDSLDQEIRSYCIYNANDHGDNHHCRNCHGYWGDPYRDFLCHDVPSGSTAITKSMPRTRPTFLQQRRDTMPERRAAAASQRQEAETASVTAEGSETVVGTDEAELNTVPMTPEAHGPRTPSPAREDTAPEAESDAQSPQPVSYEEILYGTSTELPNNPQDDDKMEVDSNDVPPLSDDEMTEPETGGQGRGIFDCDDLYKSDDSDSEDELADQFRMGHYMDQLLSDDHIPEAGIDKELADKCNDSSLISGRKHTEPILQLANSSIDCHSESMQNCRSAKEKAISLCILRV